MGCTAPKGHLSTRQQASLGLVRQKQVKLPSVGAHQSGLAGFDYEHAALRIFKLVLAAKWSHSGPVQYLLVAYYLADEHRHTAGLGQVGLEQLRSVRIGVGFHLEIQARGSE